MEALFETLSVINSYAIQQAITPFRWILGGFGIFLTLFIIFVLSQTQWMKHTFIFDVTELFTFRPYGLRRMVKKWEKIKARIETANEAEYKLAIIEADDMLGDILLRMGFFGETVGDRLKILTNTILPNLDDIKKAHQIRNSVVHNPDYMLTTQEVESTLEIYRIAFSNLDLI